MPQQCSQGIDNLEDFLYSIYALFKSSIRTILNLLIISSSVRFGLFFITFFTVPFSLVAHFADVISLRTIKGEQGTFLARIMLQSRLSERG
jgi:hypothetical protein